MSYRDGSDADRETYREFRERMQREHPDADRCAHAMPLAHRCIACEDLKTATDRPWEHTPDIDASGATVFCTRCGIGGTTVAAVLLRHDVPTVDRCQYLGALLVHAPDCEESGTRARIVKACPFFGATS